MPSSCDAKIDLDFFLLLEVIYRLSINKWIEVHFLYISIFEKWVEKVTFLCIIDYIKKKFFKWLSPQAIQLFPLHIIMFIEYK